MHPHTTHSTEETTFDRNAAGLPVADSTRVIDLADGDQVELVAAPIRKTIGTAELRLLGYNGSVPGPTLRVRQDSQVSITFTNRTDLENTVHWHGLRVENRFDGTHQTQAPVPVGGNFTYRVRFPDPGVYWYHPHIREDYCLDLGL
jgi:FtsP/CotA-like multicopper oxidase with cupredoxin domain